VIFKSNLVRSYEASQMFFKIKQKFWDNVPQEAAFNCEAAKLYKILFLSYVSYALEFS